MCVLGGDGYFFKGYGDHRELHVLTHSFPTRRCSDLRGMALSVFGHRMYPEAKDLLQRHDALAIAAMEHSGLLTGTVHIGVPPSMRSEEHTSELQSLMRISYAVFCLKKTKITTIRSKKGNYQRHHNKEQS